MSVMNVYRKLTVLKRYCIILLAILTTDMWLWQGTKVTSQWAQWRLKSPASWLLTLSFIQRRSKKTSKLRVTGLCAGNSPVTGEFPAQMASNAENVSIWWRHHGRQSYIGVWLAAPGHHLLWHMNTVLARYGHQSSPSAHYSYIPCVFQ